MMEVRERIVVIAGPTATGKSGVAVKLAEEFDGEIIGADSLQVYRHFDIGSAKPSPDELDRVPHHLISSVEPNEEYTAARFREDAARLINEIRGRGKNVFVAGGTGLYIKALTSGLFEGPATDRALRDELLRDAQIKGPAHLHERLREVDPEAAGAIHPNNLKRVVRALEVFYLSKKPLSEHHREHAFEERPYDALKIGLTLEKDELYRRIEARVERMIADGLVEETRGLIGMGLSPDLKPMGALGYKEVLGYIDGRYSLAEAVRLIKRNTRHYAKRQLTWFRKDREIRWFDPSDMEGMREAVRAHLS